MDGIIGNTASLNYNGLSLGPHVITWRVRDNQNFIAEAKVRIHIGNLLLVNTKFIAFE